MLDQLRAMTTAKKPILNIGEARLLAEMKNGDAFEVRMSGLSDDIGGKLMGANVTRVPPGKAAFPFHHHYALEEHFFIIRGLGTLRTADGTFPVKPGDYIVHPAGGPETAHQLINTGAEELEYLAISNRSAPDVCGYPDSKKWLTAPLPRDSKNFWRMLTPDADREKTQYYDGEDGAAVKSILKNEGQEGEA